MKIPKEILAVERPKSTIVRYVGGKYHVIFRKGVYRNGKSYPKDVANVGEIVDFKFIPKEKPVYYNNKSVLLELDIKDYGRVALVHQQSKDLLDDLSGIYTERDATRIYTIAVLRAAYGDIKNRELDYRYTTSYMSNLYPNVGLSKNTVSSFLEKVGMASNRINKFMENRVSKFSNKRLIIDGMLKDFNSIQNDFSQYTGKCKTKGSKCLSLLYAYNPATKEPVAAKPYQGNMLDMTSMDDFIETFDLEGSLVVMDKGILSKKLLNRLNAKKITYIIPLKNNSKIIADSKILENIDNVIEYQRKNIPFKKMFIESGESLEYGLNSPFYLYAFKDPYAAYEQESGYLDKSLKKNKEFDAKDYHKKKCSFGTITFISTVDIDAKAVYEAYDGRWEIEIMFNFYKNILERNTVDVHGPYRMVASEFINYLSIIITSRIKVLFGNLGLDEKYSYKQIFHYLEQCKKYKNPNTGKWENTKTLDYVAALAKLLGL